MYTPELDAALLAVSADEIFIKRARQIARTHAIKRGFNRPHTKIDAKVFREARVAIRRLIHALGEGGDVARDPSYRMSRLRDQLQDDERGRLLAKWLPKVGQILAIGRLLLDGYPPPHRLPNILLDQTVTTMVSLARAFAPGLEASRSPIIDAVLEVLAVAGDPQDRDKVAKIIKRLVPSSGRSTP